MQEQDPWSMSGELFHTCAFFFLLEKRVFPSLCYNMSTFVFNNKQTRPKLCLLHTTYNIRNNKSCEAVRTEGDRILLNPNAEVRKGWRVLFWNIQEQFLRRTGWPLLLRWYVCNVANGSCTREQAISGRVYEDLLWVGTVTMFSVASTVH